MDAMREPIKPEETQGGLMNEKEFAMFRDQVLKKVLNECGDVATACKVLTMLEAQLMDQR